MKLRQFETKKLFYGKYLYKLVLTNPLGTIFRRDLQKEGTLKYAKSKLDEFAEIKKSGHDLQLRRYRASIIISDAQLSDAVFIYNTLVNEVDYRVRCESSTLSIYTNKKSILSKIHKNMQVSNQELWEPSTEAKTLLLHKQNIEIVNSPTDMSLKIYFNSGRVNRGFGEWVLANRDKCRIGQILLKRLVNDSYITGHCYIRDEKVLTLVEMLIGHKIRRVDKLVYKGDIDKYKYGNKQ